MEDQNTPIFSQAKLEYTNQLIDTLTPHLFDGIKSIYDEAKTVNNVNQTQSITLLFRNFLEKVPTWSNVIIESETERIIKVTDCDWLDDLITAVFISHTKILTSIGSNTSNTNIDLVIPKTIHFIHKCYINIAREMWKNPYLFNEYIIASEYQKNMRTVELIIKESMENTIRQLLPIKEILKQHLDTYESNQTEIQKRVAANDLRQMLLDEIKNLNLINAKEEKVQPEEGGEPSEEEEEEEIVTRDINTVKEEDEEEEKEQEEEKEEEKEDEGQNTFQGGIDEDDYVSVDEDTIKQNCENLEINTINDQEERYDNVDIIEKEEGKEEKSMLEKFIQNLMPTEEEKSEEEGKDESIQEKEGSNVISNIEDILSPRKENEKEPEVKEEPVKEKEPEMKELISVEKVSDNATVDEFFNDVSRIMETKGGISVNKKPEKYTLFDDAENSE